MSIKSIVEADNEPILICVVRSDDVELLIGNLSFVDKVSLASKKLTAENLRGSCNGSNFLKEYRGLKNERTNLPELFRLHQQINRTVNINRIVAATQQISPRKVRYRFSSNELAVIHHHLDVLTPFLQSREFIFYRDLLLTHVRTQVPAILAAAQNANGNLRAQSIENLITQQAEARHQFGDLVAPVGEFLLHIDVKSKLVNEASAPKGFSISDLLRHLSTGRDLVFVLAVLVDVDARKVTAGLVPFPSAIKLRDHRITHHWSARGERGHIQYQGQSLVEAVASPSQLVDRQTWSQLVNSWLQDDVIST